MMKHLKAYDYGLALLLFIIVALIGLYVIVTSDGETVAYEAELHALSAIDSELNRDLYLLESGELEHYDSVVRAQRELHRLDNRLARIPAALSGDQMLGDVRLSTSILLSQKLVLLEDFKTAFATFKAAMDSYADLSVNGARYAAEMESLSQSQYVVLLGRLADFVHESSPEVEQEIRGMLEPPAASGAGAAASGRTPASPARRLLSILESKKGLDAVRRELAGMQMAESCEALAHAFTRARSSAQRETRLLYGLGAGVLVLLFAALAFIPRWKLGQKEIAAVSMEESLRTSLQEARAQSDHRRRDEEATATRLAEERHRALVQHSFDITAIISRQDHYIYITPSCHALFQLTDKELIGKSVYEGIHADDLIKVQDYFIRAQKELQMEQTIQYRVMDSYGEWHLVESFASNQANNPAVRGMVLNTRHLQRLGARASAEV